MIPIDRIVLGAVRRVGRAAAGMLGVAVVVATVVPVPVPGTSGRPESSEVERPAEAVALMVREGELSRSLTVTDESGRELATLTYFRNDSTLMVARCRGGPDVSCWLNHLNGRGVIELNGSVKRARIDMEPDGTTTRSVTPSPRLNRWQTEVDGRPRGAVRPAPLLPPLVCY